MFFFLKKNENTVVMSDSSGDELLAPSSSLQNTDQFQSSWMSGTSLENIDLISSSFISGADDRERLSFTSQSPLRKSNIPDTNEKSKIHDYAQVINWEEVLSLCRTHPQYASYQCPRSRLTALHHTCSRRCPLPEVADALINAYPDALLDVDDKGWTPLHHATRFKATKDIVRLLLRSHLDKGCASASMRCNKGRTPLFYAIRYDAPDGVMEMLLEANPSAVLEKDREGESPLHHVWGKYANSVRGTQHMQRYKLIFESMFGQNDTPVCPENIALTKGSELEKRWENANLLLRALFKFPLNPKDDDPKRPWRILHAVSAIQCHQSLFMLACVLHPEQANEIDTNDLYCNTETNSAIDASHTLQRRRTVLHFAAASSSHDTNIVSPLLKLNPEAAKFQDNVDGSLPLHLMSENESETYWVHEGFQALYKAYTEGMSTRDKLHRTPLHRAASVISHRQHRHTGGTIIQHLTEKFPDAAKMEDVTGRLPLHYFAESAEVWNQDGEAILAAWPEASQQRAGEEAYRRLPLHMAACSPDSKTTLIERLVQANPRAVQQSDKLGKLPLHLACECGKTWDLGVSSIYEAYPKAIGETENNPRKWTALHIAAASPNADNALITRLTELYPQASMMTDAHGRTPLHLACIASKSWIGCIKTLFEANPDAVLAADKQGLLPLHAAIMTYVSSSDISILLPNHKTCSDIRDTNFLKNTTEMDGDSMKELTQIDILYNLLQVAPHLLLVSDH